ncbi:MAG: pyrroline-5-carboxylate reductase [Gammaproteobacteria bacterium]|nr:pyrroline-5-carboxylate reductase [Gammaproteobacteria bacterium]
MKHQKIGFIGAGNMARSLASGLLANGWEKDNVVLSDPDSRQRDAIETTLGLKVYDDNTALIEQVKTVVLAVKPQVLKGVVNQIAPAIQKHKPLVISIAAGVRIADLEHILGEDIAIVRSMPNTPALIGSGASGLFANQNTKPAQRDAAESILRACGITVWVKSEDLLDVVTALSGSGPAYFFLVMEALERAAIDQGLDSDSARLLTLETAYGAAKMALEGGENPAQLRQRVTSPGGTTEQAINILTIRGIHESFSEAIAAAVKRSKELADMFGR